MRPATGERATACSHTNRKMWSKGYCSACYQKYRRRENEEYRQKHLKRNWESRIRCKFGISPEKYQEMFNQQEGKCAICAGSVKSTKRLAIDHCHKTGKVRGLLCNKCNSFLGWYEKHTQEVNNYLKVA